MSELAAILDELAHVPDPLASKEVSELIRLIRNAKRIYLSGAGRSGLMIRAFANRLMQLGFTISVVGEISEPHTQPGDLLIINSASGCSMQLLAQAKVAVSNGVKVAIITTDVHSPLAKVADTVIKIAAQSKVSQTASLQPMGSLFEQMSLLLFDAISLKLMKITGIDETLMRKNHADIE